MSERILLIKREEKRKPLKAGQEGVQITYDPKDARVVRAAASLGLIKIPVIKTGGVEPTVTTIEYSR